MKYTYILLQMFLYKHKFNTNNVVWTDNNVGTLQDSNYKNDNNNWSQRWAASSDKFIKPEVMKEQWIRVAMIMRVLHIRLLFLMLVCYLTVATIMLVLVPPTNFAIVVALRVSVTIRYFLNKGWRSNENILCITWKKNVQYYQLTKALLECTIPI